jgi:GMP synthase-like glutamine amidotransferase
MSVLILQHAEFQGPGRFVPVLRDFGIPLQVRQLQKGDEVPTDLDEIRMLIVLGGPMRVSDIGKPEYSYLAKEIETLKRMVAADRPVLGVELGAQLLAHAAGAKVYPNVKMGPPPGPGQPPRPVEPVEYLPQYGWGSVTFPFPGGTDPIVFGLHDGAQMFHFHRDTFDLPKLPAPANPPPPPAPPAPTGSVLISSTKTSKNQAFRFKNRLFGFNYHFELTREGIESLLEHRKAELTESLGPAALQQIRDETPGHYPRYARLGDRIIGNLVQFLKAY